MIIQPVITILAALGVLATIATLTQSDGADPAQRYDRPTAPECSGFGSASFVAAESLEHLLSRADTVIKGRVVDRYNDSGTLGRNYLVYDIEVKEVLVGDVTGSTITLGLSFAEVCLAPGDYEYYFFMARTNEPAPGRAIINNPAQFSLQWFGPQNVFAVESGLIEPIEGLTSPGLEQYTGVTEESFRDSVVAAASRVKSDCAHEEQP